MRRGHHLGQRCQPFVSGRLGVEHVESGAGDVSGFDRVGKRRFVDQLATRRVDDSHPLLASRETLGVDHMMGFGERRHVEGDEIGAAEEVVELDQRGSGGFGGARGDERVVGDDFHAKRAGPGRDFTADASEADDAQQFAAQLRPHELLLFPLAALHRGIGGGNWAGQ